MPIELASEFLTGRALVIDWVLLAVLLIINTLLNTGTSSAVSLPVFRQVNSCFLFLVLKQKDKVYLYQNWYTY